MKTFTTLAGALALASIGSRAMFEAEPVGGFVREWQQAGSQYAQGGAIEAVFEMSSPHGAFPFTYSGSLVGKAPLTPWPGLWPASPLSSSPTNRPATSTPQPAPKS